MDEKYAVLRLRKLKNPGTIRGALQHDTRDRVPPNAEPTRTHLNTVDRSTSEALERYEALLPVKVRKNAVHAVEFIVSASNTTDLSILPGYFKDAQKWLLERLGGAENLLHSAVHYDEEYPHLHLILMPLRQGKLNYNSFLGGNKFQLRTLQTDFAKEVAAAYGLQRGIERSGIEHRNFHAYQAQLAAPPPPIPALHPSAIQTVLQKGLSPQDLARELARLHGEAYQPLIEGLVRQANKVPILEQDKRTVMKVSSARAKENDGMRAENEKLRKLLGQLQRLVLENGPTLDAYRKQLAEKIKEEEARKERETPPKKPKKDRNRDDGLGY